MLQYSKALRWKITKGGGSAGLEQIVASGEVSQPSSRQRNQNANHARQERDHSDPLRQTSTPLPNLSHIQLQELAQKQRCFRPFPDLFSATQWSLAGTCQVSFQILETHVLVPPYNPSVYASSWSRLCGGVFVAQGYL